MIYVLIIVIEYHFYRIRLSIIRTFILKINFIYPIYFINLHMAVPKKRTSKSKSRKAQWKNKALLISEKSMSLAKSLLSNKSKSFVYLNNKLDFDEIS